MSFLGVGGDRSEGDTDEESLQRELVVSLELAAFLSESLSALLIPGCFLFISLAQVFSIMFQLQGAQMLQTLERSLRTRLPESLKVMTDNVERSKEQWFPMNEVERRLTFLERQFCASH